MTNLENIIRDLVPQNTLDKSTFNDLLSIFFKVLDNTCNIAKDIPDYVNINSEKIAEDIIKIYLQNIWQVLEKVKNDVVYNNLSGITLVDKKNYCYSTNDNVVIENPIELEDNNSTGVYYFNIGDEITVKEYTNGTVLENNKKFVLLNKLGMTPNTTVQEALNNGNLENSIRCCGDIPCAVSSLPSMNLGFNFGTWVKNYNGSDIVQSILDQSTEPYIVTDGVSRNPNGTISERSPYLIGSNWLYIDYFINDDYVKNNLDLRALQDIKKHLNEEHIWSSKSYKESKGTRVSFYFTYNIINTVKINYDPSLSDVNYIELNEKRDSKGNLIPFNYVVKSLMDSYVYEHVVKPLTHPVGFNGEYKRSLGFNFSENFCKNEIPEYDCVYIYTISDNTYFDIRDLFGSTGNNNTLRYNVEIQNIYTFSQHNKNYTAITMSNGYTYINDFNNKLYLVDNNGIIVKTYDESAGLVYIKVKIYNSSESFYPINSPYHSTTNILNVPATKVYRVEFDNALGQTGEGGFLSNQDTYVYLDNNTFYQSADSRIKYYGMNSNEIYSYAPEYNFMYNTISYNYELVCNDYQEWVISMQMRDTNCLSHWYIVQEDLNNPQGDLSEDLDLSLTQLDTYDLNTYLQDYINNNGSYQYLARDLLNKTDYNFYDGSLQGVDVNNNGIVDFEEYGYNGNLFKQDWGFTVGGDVFIGRFMPCGDRLPITENLNSTIISYFSDNYGAILDSVFNMTFNSELNEIFNTTEETSWNISSNFGSEMEHVIISGPNNSYLTLACTIGSNVQMNDYINNYILNNGSDIGLANDILNNLTPPGVVTDCVNLGTGVSGLFVADSSDPSGFNIGDVVDKNKFRINDFLTINTN